MNKRTTFLAALLGLAVIGCAAEQVNPAPQEAVDELTRAQAAISRFITPELHCNTYATMWCYRLASCGAVDWSAFRDCREVVRAETCGPLVESYERDRRTFNNEMSLECLLGLGRELSDCSDDRQYGTRWWTDRSEFSSFRSYCGRVFSFLGTGTDGQSCRPSTDCAPLHMCAGEGCDRGCHAFNTGTTGESCTIGCGPGLGCQVSSQTCRPLRTTGEPCNDGPCDAASVCDFATRRCVALPTDGEPCTRNCAPGAYCNAGMCAPANVRAEGEACAVHQDCLPSLACIDTICAARRAFGEPCTGPSFQSECQPDLLCVGTPLRCSAPRVDGLGPGPGSSCQTQFDCRRDLYCDQVYKTCLESNGGRALGEECTGPIGTGSLDVAYRCGMGLVCDGYLAARSDAPGAPGRCIEVGPMTPCGAARGAGGFSAQDPCPRGYKCINDPAVSGSPTLCRTAATGTVCTGDRECTADHYCRRANTSVPGRCQPRAGEEEECFTRSQCIPTLACVATPEGHRCQRPGGLGDSCLDESPERTCPEGSYCFIGVCRRLDGTAPDAAAEPCGSSSRASPSPPCLFGFTCRDGICVEAGELGQPCRRHTLSCNPGSWCRAGVCEALSTSGTACNFNGECASGVCYNYHCMDACMPVDTTSERAP